MKNKKNKTYKKYNKKKSTTKKIKIKMNKHVNRRKNKHLKDQTYQPDKLKMKGGMNQINILNFRNIENIQSEIVTNLYPEIENYKNGLIYFSLGSKYNEPTLKSGLGIKDEINTNSAYQMIPYFLYSDSLQRVDPSLSCYDNTICDCLCIVFDSFSLKELNDNISIIYKYFSIQVASNIKLYILNTYDIRDELLHSNSLFVFEQIIRGFCDELISKNINSKQFMLCNYVKFKTDIEETYEQSIKNMLAIVLREKDYENSHYEWFGYRTSGNYLLYDFIYLNNKFNTGNKIFVFSRLIANLVRNKIEEVKNIPRNKQIYMLTKTDYKTFINEEMLKYIYQITPVMSVGDLNYKNNLFTYSLYNTITE